MTIAFFIITCIYIILIGSFVFGFDCVKVFNEESIAEKIHFSIIIPFKNEAKHLPDLLKSLYNLDYPKHLFEILLVDDASEDNSVQIIQKFIDTKSSKGNSSQVEIQILKNNRISNSPKKDAITTAMHIAQHEWVVTTDADCIVPKKWLIMFNSFIQKNNPKMIVAPVLYRTSNTFFEQFQSLDFLSLQSATIAGFGIKKPFLCNGANLAYTKDIFITLNGFDGNTEIASGDDVFLMEKVLKFYPENLLYLKSLKASVTTHPQPSFRDLIHQRLRWAAKTASYNNIFGKLVGLAVLFMNFITIIATLLTIMCILRFEFLILLFALKLIIDLLLINKIIRFINQQLDLKSYVLSGLLYPFFSVFIAIYSMFFGFKWKGRNFKK